MIILALTSWFWNWQHFFGAFLTVLVIFVISFLSNNLADGISWIEGIIIPFFISLVLVGAIFVFFIGINLLLV